MSAPLYDFLKSYRNEKPFPFHMPGHLMGKGLSDILKQAGTLDITEIPGSDNLHAPEGVIREAQDLAAGFFGAKKTYFLVNGSTVGIHAMIHAACKPGGRILIGRDCHRSVLNAIALLDVEPVFVMPLYDTDLKMPTGYRAEDIASLLDHYPDISAVLLTRPNYYGFASPLAEIADLVHKKRIPLLIDEAHGAHFIFHDKLPKTALDMGADLCVQSLHKTLPAMTQTALLHVGKKSLIDADKVFTYLSMLQTTSPSYVLMASIDFMRETMEREGRVLYSSLYDRLSRFYERLSHLPGIHRVCVPAGDNPLEPHGNGPCCDFTRLVLSFDGISGFEAEAFLRTRKNIVVEMADLYHIVLIVTPYHTDEDLSALLEGLMALVQSSQAHRGVRVCQKPPMALPQKQMGVRAALFGKHRELSLKEAAGHISGSAIVPYPPGIPLVYPGEVISSELAAYVTEILHAGGTVYGIMGDKIKIVDDIK